MSGILYSLRKRSCREEQNSSLSKRPDGCMWAARREPVNLDTAAGESDVRGIRRFWGLPAILNLAGRDSEQVSWSESPWLCSASQTGFPCGLRDFLRCVH